VARPDVGHGRGSASAFGLLLGGVVGGLSSVLFVLAIVRSVRQNGLLGLDPPFIILQFFQLVLWVFAWIFAILAHLSQWFYCVLAGC
jgi:hypothetical protein